MESEHRTIQTFLAQDEYIELLIQNFIETKKAENLAKGTLTFYKQKLNTFQAFCNTQEIKSVRHITPDALRAFLTSLREHGHDDGGVHAYFRTIRTFLRWYEQEFEPDDWKNPIKKLKAPRVAIEPLEPVSMEVVDRMLAKCGDDKVGRRDRALLYFLLDTGVRASELLAIRLDEIDLLSGECLIRKGKGRKPRIVYIGEKCKRVLRRYLKMRNDSCPFLWVTDDGDGSLSYFGLRSKMKRMSMKAGVPTPSLHSFRYYYALQSLRNGMDVFTLQKAMGHADLQILRRYLKQSQEDVREAHRRTSPVDNLPDIRQ